MRSFLYFFVVVGLFAPILSLANSGILPNALNGPLVSCTGLNCHSFCDLVSTAQNIINFGIALGLYVLSPIFFSYGAIRIMVAAGSPQRMQEGKKILTRTFVGIALVLCAYVIVNTFLWVLGAKTTEHDSGEGVVGWPSIQCTAPSNSTSSTP